MSVSIARALNSLMNLTQNCTVG